MLPLKSSSRFQLGLGAAIFGAAGAEAFGIAPANLDVPIEVLRGFLAAVTRGVPWLVAAAFGVAGAESFWITVANLDVPIDMFKGFLATATRGMPWLGGRDEEEEVAAAGCITSVMIRMKIDGKRY